MKLPSHSILLTGHDLETKILQGNGIHVNVIPVNHPHIYIDDSGDDENDGLTLNKPIKTLTRAMAILETQKAS